jgi:hypothetical protein
MGVCGIRWRRHGWMAGGQEKGTGYFTGVKSFCQERDRKGDSPFEKEGLSPMSRSISPRRKGE